jgi:hypothetical protein
VSTITREKTISIRVTESEAKIIKEMALARKRVSVAEYLRWLVEKDRALYLDSQPQDGP